MIKKKTTQRLFWKLVSLCPRSFRQNAIRNRFNLNESLNPEIIFRQAISQDEIEQSFNLVYEAYIKLNYIDPNIDRLHLTKYLLLPTTTFLVIKEKNEVIGTLSIILDSSLGLPTDTTWNISEYRKKGMNIAEISALSIKKGIKKKSGELLLPFIKLMFSYCMDILKLDGLVIAITEEVESFYTDLLLFKKNSDSNGKSHNLVKGNKSSCCFLELNDKMKNYYHLEYSKEKKSKNLYYYFFELKLVNLKLPPKKLSIQAQNREKNQAMVKLLKEKPHLFSRFNDLDRLIISNLEPTKELDQNREGNIAERKHPRLVTMINCFIEKKGDNILAPIKILDVSESGLKIKTLGNHIDFKINDEISIKLNNNLARFTFEAKILWIENLTLGCLILVESENTWGQYYLTILNDFYENEEVIINRKAS
jgi:hypothetical protein